MWGAVMLLLAIAGVVLTIDKSAETIRWLLAGSAFVLSCLVTWFLGVKWGRDNPQRRSR